jgi:hypothetical protein
VKSASLKLFVIRNTSKIPKSRTRIEVVSKPQIKFKGKALADRESAAYIGEHLPETVLHPNLKNQMRIPR